MELFSILLIIITLIYGAIAVFQDIRKREIANWVNFSFVILLISIIALESIIKWNQSFILIGLIALGIYFGLACLFYYGRIFAGGDAKLLIGLGISLSALSISNMSLIFYFLKVTFSFLINIFAIGAVYGLIYSVVLYIGYKNKKEIEKKALEIKNKNKLFYLSMLFIALAFLILIFLNIFFLIASVAAFLLANLLIALKAVEECCLVKSIPVEALREGDWLKKPLKIRIKGEQKTILPTWDGLTASEIEKLKKYKKGQKIIIKEGLPFTPVLLIAFISYITLGNLLYYLVYLLI